jgi:hypothetical protein
MKIGLHAGTLNIVPDSVQTTRTPTEAKSVYKVPLTVHLADDDLSLNKRIAVVGTIELSTQTSKSGTARLLVKTSIPWPSVKVDDAGTPRVDTSRDVSFHSVLTLPRGAASAIRSGNESFLHGAVAFCAAIVEALTSPLFARAGRDGEHRKSPFTVNNDTGELEFWPLGLGRMTWHDEIKDSIDIKDIDRDESVALGDLPDLVRDLATGMAPAIPDKGAEAVVLPAAFFYSGNLG